MTNTTNNEQIYNIFSDVGIIIDILDNDNFLKIVETLTRIGVASINENKLFQSCHILHKRDDDGKSIYAIVHFKEMFKLDGKNSSINKQDIQRRNTIAKLLEDWNLLKITDNRHDFTKISMSLIKVLPYSKKHEWELIQKYKVGKKQNGSQV